MITFDEGDALRAQLDAVLADKQAQSPARKVGMSEILRELLHEALAGRKTARLEDKQATGRLRK